jgi:1-acyl-sn-glycerol-3-phosphate acyltransferase
LGAGKWAVDFPKELDPKGIYLVIANHQSWTDILILSYVLNKKVAPLKFFMKKELKWQLPVIGLACKAIGFPMLSRHTKAQIKKNPSLKNKDRESTVQACEFVKRHPASLIIFPEGSRFTKQKHARQNSPYQNLLKPKAGGAAMTINGVDDGLQGILDLTVDYSIGRNEISFWDFLQGKYKSIEVYATLLPLATDLKGNYEDDKDYRKRIQSWLTERWQLKDKILSGSDVSE